MGHPNSELTSSFMEPSPLVHKAIHISWDLEIIFSTWLRIEMEVADFSDHYCSIC